MTWSNILVPVMGGETDAPALATAKALAEPFNATITMVFASISPYSTFNWANEAGIGPTDVAIAAIEHSADVGQGRCRDLLAALDYPKKAFEAVYADDWTGLRTACRLADVVVWDRSVGRGHGFFAPAFQQILLDERRPALLADAPLKTGGVVAVAWDGGREASRAVRRSVPLLRKAQEVVLFTAPHTMATPCDGARALSYLADLGVHARAEAIHGRAEAARLVLDAVHRVGARLLVAGAFGHPRLQRFIFGGTTQILLESRSPSALFLSH